MSPGPSASDTQTSPHLAVGGVDDNRSAYPAGQVPKYGKFEIAFQIENTVAGNYQLPYDASPPAGIEPDVYPRHNGITVDGLFTPDGWQTVYRQPAFYYQYFHDDIRTSWDGQEREWNYPTGQFGWKIRFAPNQTGTWQYKIVAQDAGGVTESPAQYFTVAESPSKGFIQVSSRDPRYFEFEDGTPFFGLGFHDSPDLDNPVLKKEPYYEKYAQNDINFLRMWVSGLYGSAWLEWLGGRNIYDGYLPRTGLEPFRDTIRNQVVLTQRIDYGPAGDTGWYDACRFQRWNDPEAIKPYTDYRLRIRYWGMGIAGPRMAESPDHGLVGKITTSWIPQCYEPGTGTVVTNYGGNTSDWGHVEGTWNSGSHSFLPRVYLGLENVTEGKVYVESISLREDLGNGQYGPEIIAESSLQYELYFPQAASHSLDRAIELAEEYGIYLKLVLGEKDDSVFLKLNDDGTFVIDGQADNASGFYGLGREMNKTRWLQQAHWRYMQARWGYSTRIHSWELTNEGDPWLTKHYEAADELGKYMHCGVFGVDVGSGDGQKCEYDHPNSHLVTTSFWHSFPARQFWHNARYPNVDYADVHAYVSTSRIGLARSELEKMQWDSAYYHTRHSEELAGWNIGKPIVRGEAGLNLLGHSGQQPDLAKDTEGIWLHKYVWSTVAPGALYELYWWRDNIQNQPGPDGMPGLYEVYRAFYSFVRDVPLSNGHYQDASLATSHDSLRAWGQKDVANGRAHLWIDNANHTWKNVVDGVPIAPQSGTVSFSGMPAGAYAVSWYDTYTGEVVRTAALSVGNSGVVVLDVADLATDIAVKVDRRD